MIQIDEQEKALILAHMRTPTFGITRAEREAVRDLRDRLKRPEPKPYREHAECIGCGYNGPAYTNVCPECSRGVV